MFQNAIEKVGKSVFYVYCPNGSTGTGVILTDDGYAVTAAHVVKGNKKIKVLTTTKNGFIEADVLFLQESFDVAIIKIQCIATEKFTPIEIGDTTTIYPGNFVCTIDTQASHGISGSPLFTPDGKVIGMMIATLNDPIQSELGIGEVPTGLSFAWSIDFACKLLENKFGKKTAEYDELSVKVIGKFR